MTTEENINDPMQTEFTAPSITAQIEQAFNQDRMAFRCFHMITVTSLMFGVFGGLIGWIMTLVTPAYFRDVYDTLESDVWQVGLGIGFSRGVICGVLISCSVMLAMAWYRSRVKNTLIQQVERAAEVE